MKKSLTIVSLLAGAVGAYAQGQIQFIDYLPATAGAGQEFCITIWSPQAATPGTQITGNGPTGSGGASTFINANNTGDLPNGTTTSYTGTALGGANTGATSTSDFANGNLWSVQLYAAPGSGQTTLYPINGAVSTMYTFGGTGNAGQFPGTGNVTLNAQTTGAGAGFGGIADGAIGTFALAAWYNGGGTLTFAQAQTAGDPAAFSPSENITLNSPPNSPSSLSPIPSFSLTAVPEPSTVALAVMGASAFLLRLRRKF